MGILFRYVIREFLKIFGFCLSGIFVIYFAVHFFDIIRRYARYDPSFDALARYFLLRIPQVLLDVIPLALLLAVVVTLGLLGRNHELVAMRSAGISPAWITMPFLIVSLVLSLFLTVFSHSILPLLKQQTEIVKDLRIKKKPVDLYFRQSRIWLRPAPDTFMNVQLADAGEETLYGVNLYRISGGNALSEFIEAEKVRYEDHRWIAFGAVRRTFLPDGRLRIEPMDGKEIPLDRKPADFVRVDKDTGNKDTDTMTYARLAAYTRLLEKEGYDAQRYRVDLHTKTSLPFIPFVFALVGAPLALNRRVGGAISRGVGLSLLMALAYWIAYSFSLSLGYGQVLPAALAAWLPNGLFAAAGSWLIYDANR